MPKTRRKPQGADEKRGRFLSGYDAALSFCLRHNFLVALVFLASTALSIWLVQSAPKGFFPQEDIGQLAFIAAGHAISLTGLPGAHLSHNGFFDVQVSERTPDYRRRAIDSLSAGT